MCYQCDKGIVHACPTVGFAIVGNPSNGRVMKEDPREVLGSNKKEDFNLHGRETALEKPLEEQLTIVSAPKAGIPVERKLSFANQKALAG